MSSNKNYFLKLQSFFFEGSNRSMKMKRNVLYSFLIKFIDVILTLLLVSILIKYLGQENYGIWATIYTTLAWFTMLDIGLGNGLRNKLTESLAKNDLIVSKKYVSTTYALSILLMSVFFFIYIIFESKIKWHALFNTDKGLEANLETTIYILVAFFLAHQILKIINVIFLSKLQSAKRDLILLLEKLSIFIVILFLSFFSDSSIIKISLAYSIPPLFIILIGSIYLYGNNFNQLKPSIKFVDFKLTKDLLNLGMGFFIIQISVVILFTTDNLIISHLFGPEFVTPYQVVSKYFHLVLTLFIIIVVPIWSSITDAYIKKDIEWVKKIFKYMLKIWFFFAFLILIMIILYPLFFDIWLGDQLIIPQILVISWGLFTFLHTLNLVFTHILNGIGKIRVQIITALFSIIFNIPLSILFAKNLGLGSSGVILASCFSMIIYVFFRSIQCYKLIFSKATGIWNK